MGEAMSSLARRPLPPRAVSLLTLALTAAALVACSPRYFANQSGRTVKPTITVGSTNFSEQVILAELYAQALEGNGYRIERRLNLGSREAVEPALVSGRIDLYPEYLATLLAFVTGGADRGSPDPAATYGSLRQALEPLGISVLDYAPAVNTNGFVVTRSTAEKYQLAKLSDLAPVAPQLVLGGPPECPLRPFCLTGLRATYGIDFKDFRVLDTGGPLTVAALEGGQVDVALLFSTDPLIRSKQFVLLADDRSLQLADNVAPVVRTDLLNRAPADFQTLLNGVSAKLTTDELTRLNAQVVVEGQQPKNVAEAWLRSNGPAR
jgi:osmoprotectant transport system substrate-binding protein